jgi:Protein of unknown function (DUF3313)
MNLPTRFAAALVLGLASASVSAQPARTDVTAEGLVAVKARKVSRAWLLPGADFRPYKKVLLKNAEVAFKKNWLRDVNDTGTPRMSSSGRVTEADALKILDTARSGFDKVWAQAFKTAGYEVVTAPGDDVLEVAPRVVDLYVNAPASSQSGVRQSYTMQSGDATLFLEVRDSRAGTLLGRVSDRRETLDGSAPQRVTSASTVAEFERLFAVWADIAVKGIEELKAASPMPESIKPGQRIAAPKK